MNINLAPIVLFVYNRPEHTRQTVEALKKNTFAKESEIFIYSDAAKNKSVEENVAEVRNYVKSIHGFRKVTIYEQTSNLGLANSIISGVTEVIKKYKKVIVLEDDLVTSPYFLTFMNDALNYYQDEKKVWHISGWNYPIDNKGLEDVFFWRMMNCWGWATWDDRWKYYEKDAKKLLNTWSKDRVKSFNLDGACDTWRQVKDNEAGKINTWAVFWYASIFKNEGLCLNPTKTYVQNIGLDGTGENCGTLTGYQYSELNHDLINFPKIIEVSNLATFKIKNFYLDMKTPIKNNYLKFIFRIFNKILMTFKSLSK